MRLRKRNHPHHNQDWYLDCNSKAEFTHVRLKLPVVYRTNVVIFSLCDVVDLMVAEVLQLEDNLTFP